MLTASTTYCITNCITVCGRTAQDRLTVLPLPVIRCTNSVLFADLGCRRLPYQHRMQVSLQLPLQGHVGTKYQIVRQNYNKLNAHVSVSRKCATARTSRSITCCTETASGQCRKHHRLVLARSQSSSSSQFDVDDGTVEQLGIELGPREDDILPDSLADAIQDVSARLKPSGCLAMKPLSL